MQNVVCQYVDATGPDYSLEPTAGAQSKNVDFEQATWTPRSCAGLCTALRARVALSVPPASGTCPESQYSWRYFHEFHSINTSLAVCVELLQLRPVSNQSALPEGMAPTPLATVLLVASLTSAGFMSTKLRTAAAPSGLEAPFQLAVFELIVSSIESATPEELLVEVGTWLRSSLARARGKMLTGGISATLGRSSTDRHGVQQPENIEPVAPSDLHP